MVPSKKVDKTPYEIWHGQAPKLSYLRVWGCEAFVKHDTLTKPDKLDPRSFKSIFIGYPKETMGYSFYSPSENKVFVARNAEFFESKLLDLKASGTFFFIRVVEIFESSSVAKGFQIKLGVDYEETFSPVADIRAIRILIAIAAYYDYEIWQMDVKTAFLNGHLAERTPIMEQPVQASRQWNKRFDDEIKKFGFAQNPDEPCVYLKASGSYVAILILYVDDILLMGNNIPMLQDVKSYLGRSFAMKDLGDAAYILGIKIYRDRSKRLIGLNQSAYIEKILKRFYMENSKRGTIPMQEKLKLSKSQGASTPAEKQRMQNIPYASAIGSIMYAVRCTRPDVAFAQNMIVALIILSQQKTQLSKERCMKSLREVKSQFKFLTETLQDFGTMSIFKRTFSQDLDLLEQHFIKEIISQTDCKTILTILRTTFENAFNPEFKARMLKYTRFDAQSLYDAMIFNMDSIGKYMLEITLHQQRTPHFLKQKKLMQTQEYHSNPIPALNVDSLKVDLVVIQNTCSEKEDTNSETASNISVKESSLDSATKDVHAIKYKMSKAKERCMTYFRSLHSHLQVLSKQYL
ncbi:retrotransposon protein, putative, ty1-copia subclass [Tanacetum coccineum]